MIEGSRFCDIMEHGNTGKLILLLDNVRLADPLVFLIIYLDLTGCLRDS